MAILINKPQLQLDTHILKGLLESSHHSRDRVSRLLARVLYRHEQSAAVIRSAAVQNPEDVIIRNADHVIADIYRLSRAVRKKHGVRDEDLLACEGDYEWVRNSYHDQAAGLSLVATSMERSCQAHIYAPDGELFACVACGEPEPVHQEAHHAV